MRIGVGFPTVEMGADLAAVRDFVQTAEGLGYTHMRILDHVLGADPAFHPEVPIGYHGWSEFDRWEPVRPLCLPARGGRLAAVDREEPHPLAAQARDPHHHRRGATTVCGEASLESDAPVRRHLVHLCAPRRRASDWAAGSQPHA
jgi:hypothetical protein